jgi:hypothetical protein
VLQRTLASVWLGLQMNDDVVDWEDDFGRGGAWAVSLALGTPMERDSRAPEMGIRRRVFATRALETMLARAQWHFSAVRRRSAALGARELGAWAADRERKVALLRDGERQSAGYAVRAHALAAWAGEVLA